MKKTLTLFSILLLAGIGRVQGQSCPKIVFTYDENGNRIERELIITSCGGGQKLAAPQEPSFPISVYPNPALDKINIGLAADSTVQTSAIQLFDLSGKEVYSTVTPALHSQIDVTKLGAGSYILKVTRGKKYATYNVKKS